ncbi:MAG TPA: PD-(D/E)XK nuclease family protein [Myxococcota bacterium]|nr:PD-(D/E)XK nuclease family protein [Myxococcota bacterium]
MPRVVVARGARAIENRLLGDLAALLPRGEAAALGLEQPVRIVVPSGSLRDHLGAAIVRRSGRAVAGIEIHTLHGLARDMLERAGVQAPAGEELLPILVGRSARLEEELRERLDPLREGYATLTGTISDLLDAGFDAAHAAALDDALCEFDAQTAGVPGGRAVARMRALIRVAAHAAREFSRLGLGRASTRLGLARETLERDPERALPARAVLVHGFAEATGEASALIEALCRHRNATVYLDHPPDPANPKQSDFGVRFTQRLRERLLGTAELTEDLRPEPNPARIETLRAGDGQSEVRAVADRVRRLLDGPAPPRPEEIGIVARTLRPYAQALRLHLGCLAIPFSSSRAEAPRSPSRSRVDALLDLLRRRELTPTDRWLEARGDLTSERRCDLRVALHTLGVARLGDLALLRPGRDLDAQKDRVLPVCRGLGLRGPVANERVEGPAIASAMPRILPFETLAGAIRAAGRLCQGFADLPPSAPLAEHLARLGALVGELAFPPGLLAAALDTLERALPSELPLAPEEFHSLLEGALAAELPEALGGAGAGVQVLDAMAARGRTFSHLFVLGLNRDVFPRVVQEDPFLPDAVRRALLPVLPDLALKETGFVEERYLFAQLLSASSHVTLCWQVADDDGKPMAPSPLVQRMRATLGSEGPPMAPSLYAPPAGGDAGPRPAYEHAVLAGLYGGPHSFARVLALAIRESQGPAPPKIAAPRLADARIAILQEFDPRFRARGEDRKGSLLGPYFGFVGAVREAADPRQRPLYVTVAEQLAACPWQVFVRRFLRIQTPPDALGELPRIDARLIGATVHAALEEVVASLNVPARLPLEEAVRTKGTVLSWPEEHALLAILQAAAEKVCRDEGIALPGFTQTLAALALAGVRAARTAEGGRAVTVLGVEVDGACTVPDVSGRPRTVRFRADRVDEEDGALRLTDYKVGRSISELKTPEMRARDFRDAVRRGERLQAMAYALGAAGLREAPEDACGRYLFLGDGLENREFEVRADDPTLGNAFHEALRATFAVLDAGSLFPRLLEPDGSGAKRCEFCDVHEACLRGDSGSRLRLEAWAKRKGESFSAGSPPSADEAAFMLWRLKAEVSP